MKHTLASNLSHSEQLRLDTDRRLGFTFGGRLSASHVSVQGQVAQPGPEALTYRGRKGRERSPGIRSMWATGGSHDQAVVESWSSLNK